MTFGSQSCNNAGFPTALAPLWQKDQGIWNVRIQRRTILEALLLELLFRSGTFPLVPITPSPRAALPGQSRTVTFPSVPVPLLQFNKPLLSNLSKARVCLLLVMKESLSLFMERALML